MPGLHSCVTDLSAFEVSSSIPRNIYVLIEHRRHSKTHESRYPCDLPECASTFKTAQKLHRHRNTVRHGTASIELTNLLKCGNCSYTTARKDNFGRHTKQCGSRDLRGLNGTADTYDRIWSG